MTRSLRHLFLTSLVLTSAAFVGCSDGVEEASPAGGAGSTSAGSAGSGTAGSSTAGSSAAGSAGSTAGAAGSAVAGAAGSTTAGAAGSSAGGAGAPSAKPEVIALSDVGHDRLLGVTFDAAGNAFAVGAIADTTDAAADFATIVLKFGVDGKLDKTFGTDGVARHNLVVGTSGEAARGIAVQADGKIVVGATVDHLGGDPKDRDVAVVRLLATGALDTSFGTGGVAVFDLSPGAVDGTGFSADQQWGLALTSDGKILVSTAKKASATVDRDFALLRVTSDGKLDPTFGTAGVLSLDIAGQGADPRGLTLLADGTALASGYTKDAAGIVSPVVYKATAEGKLDPAFGNAGVFNQVVLPHTTECYGVAKQGDKLVTLGYGKAAEAETLDWVSLRLTADGKLDTTWGDKGVVRVDDMGFNDNGRTILGLPDGRVLLAGSGRSDASTADAMVAVLGKDGAPDETFGAGGKRVYDLGGTGDQFWSSALSPDGKRIVLVGVKGSTTTNDDAAVFFLSVP